MGENTPEPQLGTSYLCSEVGQRGGGALGSELFSCSHAPGTQVSTSTCVQVSLVGGGGTWVLISMISTGGG